MTKFSLEQTANVMGTVSLDTRCTDVPVLCSGQGISNTLHFINRNIIHNINSILLVTILVASDWS